ncbi:DUF2383 domain-containing protein [Gymnodinialimonas ceratoperidinii]|uniref:PA2169 family four-helix-bundle protein n=1 Tax=Gymnodinialimonas ceratoperidinii TaxID=2856823 RepID=A0A8F6TUB8_9RHOB|nr:DUF2383 domain-containing protein [Gymnodinialimonas ceratoperidinii]QXT39101.1 PA2169 family four-helix-bundle protein [Gymnodinialimonas ceratoperidinii]
MAVTSDLKHTAEASDAVARIATDVADVCDGYVVMAGRADEDLKPIVQRLYTMHATHLGALKAHLASMGGEPAEAGSPMGKIYQAMAAVRGWIGKLDLSALPQIIDGEQALVDSYDASIAATTEGTPIHVLLNSQQTALRAQIAVLKL